MAERWYSGHTGLMTDPGSQRAVPAWWPTDGEEPDPRWSLANERTLLAYNRTALALVVAGLAVSGSHAVADAPAWLAAVGLPMIALGALLAYSSRGRFLEAQHAMRTGEPLPAPSVAALLPYGIAVVAVAAVALAAYQLTT